MPVPEHRAQTPATFNPFSDALMAPRAAKILAAEELQ